MGRALLSRQEREFFSGGPRDAAILSAASTRALKVWAGFALLLALSAAPLFSTVLPPLFDYPNHLARMHLLAEGGNAFYDVRWAPLPNLAQDLIVPELGILISLELASKLFVLLIFALIGGGSIWLNRVATGAWRLWPLLSFLLLYNRVFLWGFLNYLFGIGIALCGIALWLALERRRWWVRALISSFIAVFCYISHIAAFGFYALVLLGVELLPALAEMRARRWPALSYRMAIAGAQFILPTGLFFGYWQPTAAAIGYADFWRKADLLFSVFDNYNRAFDITCFSVFLALFGWLVVTRRLQTAPRLCPAVFVVLLAYIVLPSQLFGGSGLDHRLPLPLFLLVIAASEPRFPSGRAAFGVGVVAGSVLLARLTIIEMQWRQADRIYSADLAGLDKLPRGAKLAIAIPPDAVHMVSVPEVHLATLAIARREVFVPTLFAYSGQQPIVLKPAYAALAEAASPQRFWAVLTGGEAMKTMQLLPVLQQYDYIVFTGRRPINVPPNHCIAAAFKQPSFQIFSVLHNPDCAGLTDSGKAQDPSMARLSRVLLSTAERSPRQNVLPPPLGGVGGVRPCSGDLPAGGLLAEQRRLAAGPIPGFICAGYKRPLITKAGRLFEGGRICSIATQYIQHAAARRRVGENARNHCRDTVVVTRKQQRQAVAVTQVGAEVLGQVPYQWLRHVEVEAQPLYKGDRRDNGAHQNDPTYELKPFTS
ncbi:MAG: hypothetical protein WA633_22005 [Stellaceae bacterium]